MISFVLNRFVSGCIVILGLTVLSFLLVHLVPGDPVQVMLGIHATPERMEELRSQLGLDKPLWTQYVRYLSDLLHGDLGTSIKTGRPVLVEIADRFPETAKLAVSALVIAIVIGILTGTLAARFKGSFIDALFTGFATLGVSIPSFWLGILLVMLFSVTLKWFPIANGTGFRDMILPALTLGVVASTLISRLTRNGMVDALSNDYIRTARAKGLEERTILFRHALRNVLIPVVTVIGLQLASLIGGTVIIEQVFNWPGLGTMAIGSILSRDFPLIQGTILFMGVVYVVINTIVDILYHAIDPRVEFGAKVAS